MNVRLERQGGVHPMDEIRLLGLAVNATDRAIVILNEKRRVAYVNRAFTNLFGYAREEVFDGLLSQFLAGAGTDTETLEHLRSAAILGQAIQADILVYTKSGRELWVSISINSIGDEENNFAENDLAGYLVLALVDITTTREIQTLQQAVLQAVACGRPLAEVADLICRRVEEISPNAFSSMLLIDEKGKLRPLAGPRIPPSLASVIDGQPIGESAGSCGTAAYHGKPVYVTDISIDPLWADYKHLVLPHGLHACWSSPIRLRDGRVAGTFAFYYNEKRRPSVLDQHLVSACLHLSMLAIESDDARQKIAHLSHFDTLTGLPNRRFLYIKANELLQGDAAGETAFFALNLGHFKDVNDTLGHAAGDQVLVEIACRFEELVHPLGIVSRTQGDVFMVVLSHCDVSRASIFANKLLGKLGEPISVSGISLCLSASIGISIAQGRSVVAEIFAEQAVTAMQQAKLTGRANYHFYKPEQNEIAKNRLILGNALRAALANGSLHLVYQPKVRLDTLELTGVEALSRWKDPLLGEIAPDKFIPLAEEVGLIEDIGNWSIREACRQMTLWIREGVPVPNIAVNLSPLHFHNRILSAFIETTLTEYQLPPSCLCVEITEGVMIDQDSEVLATAMALHDIGVALSIDDFGTGFSTLSRLTRLPVTELKLDQTFVHNIAEDPNAQAVATAVISIGKSLGMTVVSEGVETENQAQLLKDLGCPIAQGYFFGRPMAADQIEAYLSRSRR